jgi:osmotically-inducible protein OsmY
MGTYRNENRNDWRNDQSWRPGDNDRSNDRDRDRGERGQSDDDRMRFASQDTGRFEDRSREDRSRYPYDDRGPGYDDPRDRYGGRYGQSGANSGAMGQSTGSQGYGREQTNYGRDQDNYGSARETTGYGYGGGMGMMGDREGYHYGDRGGPGYGTQGGGFGGGMAGGQRYGGGVASGRERDLGAYGNPSRGDSPWRGEGGHRGKGPQGYQRSDERIKEEVCQALSDDDHIDATHIEISVKGGEVTLSGHVTDRRTKRMAEDVIERVAGVKDVTNQIRVQSETNVAPGNGKSGKSSSESVSNQTDKDTDASRRPRA